MLLEALLLVLFLGCASAVPVDVRDCPSYRAFVQAAATAFRARFEQDGYWSALSNDTQQPAEYWNTFVVGPGCSATRHNHKTQHNTLGFGSGTHSPFRL
jgi:hypothetical protein